MSRPVHTAPEAAAAPERSACTTSAMTKNLDKSSPALMLHLLATAEHIPSGLITVRQAGREAGRVFEDSKLTDILGSSIQHAVHGGICLVRPES